MTKKKVFDRILVVSDMHHPFCHPDTVPFLQALEKKHKFDKIVIMGDELDGSSWSYHEANTELPSPGDELKQAIKALQPIYKLFPNAEVLESNHGSLAFRKGLTAKIPAAFIKDYREQIQAPLGWKWHKDLILQTALGPVFFIHGITSTSGALSNRYSMSAVQCHYHSKCQITYMSSPERLRFDAHFGCLINDKSLAFKYNKLSPIRPIISVGIIINGIPQIIPMVLNRNGRWTKSI